MKIKFLILLFLAASLYSYTGSEFLLINNSAESSAAGGTGVAKFSDISFSLINPASPLKNYSPQISLSHIVLNEYLNYEYLSVGFPLFNLLFSIHFIYLYSPETFEIIYGENTSGTITYYDTSFIFSSALKIKNYFSFGLNLKYIKREVADNKSTGWALDSGIIKEFNFLNFDKRTYDNFALGLAVKNLGTKMKFLESEENLPLTFSFGISYSPYKFISILYDLNKTISKDFFHYIGAEYKKFYFIPRIGVQIEKEPVLMLGAGINYNIKYIKLKLNYSLTLFGKATKSHFFSLNLAVEPVTKTIVKTNKIIQEKIVEKPVYFPVVINTNIKITKIAVLPFENLSNSPDLEYLTKAIPESISSFLIKRKNLEVLDLNSINARLKSLSVSLEDFFIPDGDLLLGKILNVEHIVRGSFISVENKIRVITKVVNIKSGNIITADTVEGEMEKDLFLLLDKTASNILTQISKFSNN